MIEAELSDGTILELPDSLSPEALRNYVERAEARIRGGGRQEGTTPPGASTPEEGATPDRTWQDTLVEAGGAAMDWLGAAKRRLPETVVGRALNTEIPGTAWIGRGLLGRNPAIGGADLVTAATNIGLNQLGKIKVAPLDPNNPQPISGDMPGGELPPEYKPLVESPPQFVPPSATIGSAIGLPQQSSDASYPERIGEAAVSVLSNPVGAFRNVAGPVAGLARSLDTTAAGSAGIANTAAPYAERAGQAALGTKANVVGQAASAAGGVVGGDVGEAVGGDIGMLLGALAGGVTPSTAGNYAARPLVQRALAKPGGGSARALELLERAGISPTPGLVGNTSMSRLENTAAAAPIVGVAARNAQTRNWNQFQDRVYDEANEVGRRAPATEGPTGLFQPGVTSPVAETADIVGARMRQAAIQGEQNLRQHFDEGYTGIARDVPRETLVKPTETYTELTRLQDPYGPEGPATKTAAAQALETNLDPAVVPQTSINFGPNGPVPTTELGVPFQAARGTRTGLFQTADRNPSAVSAGAQEQLRGAFTQDMERALLNDPRMVQAFPDPAARQNVVQRLRTLDREYAQELSREASTSIPPSLPQGGGAFPVLDLLQGKATDVDVYNAARNPDRMAVLQRTDPQSYPQIAGDVITRESQGPNPFGDLNISPTVMARWWNSMGENQKLIMANENPDVVRRLNDLASVGNLFQERAFTENRSNTAPMLTTIGAGAGAITAPVKTLGTGVGLLAASMGVSSDTLARYLARTNPQALEMLQRRGVDAAVMAGGQTADRIGIPPSFLPQSGDEAALRDYLNQALGAR